MYRRTVLGGIGVGATAGLAGCLVSDNGNGAGDDDVGDDTDVGDDADDADDDEDQFPTEDIRMLIPFGPGGGFDTLTRMVARDLEDVLEVGARPENVEGANGSIALDEAYNSEPDGHTMVTADEFMYNNQFTMDVQFRLEEMTYFAQVQQNITSLAVGTGTDIHSWDDFASELEAGNVRIGTPSPTASGVLALYNLGEETGDFDPELIPDNLVMYDGAGEIYTGIAADDVQAVAIDHSSHVPYIDSGDLRVPTVFITDDEPPSNTPDAETLPDIGLDDDAGAIIEGTGSSYMAFAGPPDVPESRRAVLSAALEEVIDNEEFKAEAEEVDMPIQYASGETVEERMIDAYDAWQENLDLLEHLREAVGE